MSLPDLWVQSSLGAGFERNHVPPLKMLEHYLDVLVSSLDFGFEPNEQSFSNVFTVLEGSTSQWNWPGCELMDLLSCE